MPQWLLNYAPVIALCISLLALIASGFTLGWNIYRDVVMKPKLLVDFGIKNIIDRSEVSKHPLLIISATNYGPGQVTCEMATIKKSSLFRILLRRVQHFAVIQDYTNPLCFKLPNRMNMAEKINLVFPYDRDCFLEARPTHVGVTDSFGRVHWAPRKQVREALAQYEEEFPESNQEK
jgi:hypothetical protein